MPRVSIIIPAYNPGAYLEKTLESVVAQTFQDWEAIVVDDGSKEDISQTTDRFPGVRLIRQENAGPAVARNQGMLAARGEWIAFLDADDIWLPGKLEAQLKFMAKHPDIQLSHTQFELMEADGTLSGTRSGQAIRSYPDLLRGSHIRTSTVLMRRDCLAKVGLFNPDYRGPEDYEFFLRFVRHYASDYLDMPLMYYRVHAGSISRNYRVMYRDVIKILQSNLTLAKANQDREAIEAAEDGMRQLRIDYSCIAFELCRAERREKDWKEFFPLYRFALKLRPTYVLRSTLMFALGKRGNKTLASMPASK